MRRSAAIVATPLIILLGWSPLFGSGNGGSGGDEALSRMQQSAANASAPPMNYAPLRGGFWLSLEEVKVIVEPTPATTPRQLGTIYLDHKQFGRLWLGQGVSTEQSDEPWIFKVGSRLSFGPEPEAKFETATAASGFSFESRPVSHWYSASPWEDAIRQSRPEDQEPGIGPVERRIRKAVARAKTDQAFREEIEWLAEQGNQEAQEVLRRLRGEPARVLSEEPAPDPAAARKATIEMGVEKAIEDPNLRTAIEKYGSPELRQALQRAQDNQAPNQATPPAVQTAGDARSGG